MWWMMSETGGHYCSKKTDDICADICGQVKLRDPRSDPFVDADVVLLFFFPFFLSRAGLRFGSRLGVSIRRLNGQVRLFLAGGENVGWLPALSPMHPYGAKDGDLVVSAV